jgi:cytochrome c biogenesis protein CcdA
MVLFGLVSLDFLHLPMPRFGVGDRAGRNGVAGALAYGLALGGGTTACSFSCNPLLPMAMGAAVLKGTTILGAAMLGTFAIGYSLPLAAGLVGIGLGVGRLGRWMQRSMSAVRIGGGVVLIVVGFYLLAGA